MRLAFMVPSAAVAFCLTFCLGGQAFAAPAATPAATPVLDQDFTRQLRQLFNENPDILLDVLRDNSETMLDIVQEGSEQRRRQALIRQWQTDMKTPKNASLENRPVRGDVKSPVTLIAFSDFTCTYCQQGALTVENLLRRYPGEIRFIFKQSPNSETGRLASAWFLAATRLDPAKAWRFYAFLFDRQQDLMLDTMAVLAKTATDVGLDPKAVEKELADNKKAIDDIINVDLADAKRLGFNGTPYFLVNDLVIRGAVPLENFMDAVDMAKAAVKSETK